MTEERRSGGVYTRRRDLRAAPLPPPPPGTLAAWSQAAPDRPPPPDPSSRFDGSPPLERAPAVDPDAGSRGPTTQDLELYRPDPARPYRRPAPDPAELSSTVFAGDREPADRGERARAVVERWSLWAAGLGKPPRDRYGRRRYPGREGLLPPALLLVAALGVAGLAGLLTGLLLDSSGGGAAAASAAVPTVTVTRSITAPAVTETTTRTRTRTVTPTEQAQDPNPRTVLGFGSQGPGVTQLQQDLAALGLYQGQPTGSYDAETRAGVRAFQGGFGVAGDPSGVAGPATRAALAHAAGRA